MGFFRSSQCFTILVVYFFSRAAHGLVFQPFIKDPFDDKKYEIVIYDDIESLHRLMPQDVDSTYEIETKGNVGTYTDCVFASVVNSTSSSAYKRLQSETEENALKQIEEALQEGLKAIKQEFVTTRKISQLTPNTKEVDGNKEVTISKSVTFREGFWAYRYTFEKELLQYAGERLNYTLGTYTKNSVPQLLSNEDGFYISETYDMGTLCDITGNPRSVEIQYVCDANIANSPNRHATIDGDLKLLHVKEWKICQYQAVIAVSSLCDIPLLNKASESLESTKVFCKDPNSKEKKLTNGSSSNDMDVARITSFNHKTYFVGNSYYYMKSKDDEKPDYMVSSVSPSDFSMNAAFSGILNPIGSMVLGKLVYVPEMDSLTSEPLRWMCEVFGLNGEYIFTIIVKLGVESMVELQFLRLHDQKHMFRGNFQRVDSTDSFPADSSGDYESVSETDTVEDYLQDLSPAVSQETTTESPVDDSESTVNDPTFIEEIPVTEADTDNTDDQTYK